MTKDSKNLSNGQGPRAWGRRPADFVAICLHLDLPVKAQGAAPQGFVVLKVVLAKPSRVACMLLHGVLNGLGNLTRVKEVWPLGG